MTTPPPPPAADTEPRAEGARRGRSTRPLVVTALIVAAVVTLATLWLMGDGLAPEMGVPGDPTADDAPADGDDDPATDTTDESDEPESDDQADPTDPASDVPADWAEAWEAEDPDELVAWFEATTGLTDPEALEPVEGQVTSQRDGEVIEDLDITWSTEGQPRPNSQAAIRVVHDDVTIRNVRILAEGPSRGIEFGPDTSGGRVEHCEIDGADATYGTGRDDANYGNDGIIVQGGPVDVEFCHIYGVRVGLQAVPGAEVAHNRIHSLHQNAPDTSTSSIQRHPESPVDELSLIRANLTEAGTSGGITMYAENDAVRNAEVSHNLVVGVGRGFGIRGGRSHVDAGHYLDNRDVRIEGNRFVGEFGFPQVLGEGTNAGVDLERPGNTFTGNRWWGDDQDVSARCGVSQDDCEGPNA